MKRENKAMATKRKMKKIGVLTSGGNAPGMNACIRAIVRSASSRRVEIVGIRRGYWGLINKDMIPLGEMRVSGILQRGGTFLDSERCEDIKTSEGIEKSIDVLKSSGIGGLIVIGGDGAFRAATKLAETGGVKVIGIPATIDNDVYGTDFSIGFDTAVNTALQAIDRIRDSAESLQMLFFVEVMGRSRGFIALAVGIAGGANEILIPETETNIGALSQRLEKRLSKGLKSALVVVAEGETPDGARSIAEKVGKKVNIEYRCVSLGHVQRGGAPTAKDRILASELGVAAVYELLEGQHGVMVGESGSTPTCTPLKDTWGKRKELDPHLLEMLHTLAV